MKNEIIIHGYLGRDPELKGYTTARGETGKFCNFSVGVSRDFEDKTDWFACTIFGRRAEVIEKFFHKGSQIVVSGRMQSERYTGRDGVERTAWKIIVSDFDFCDSQNSPRGANNSAVREEQSAPAPAQTGSVQASFDDLPDSFQAAEDDIPF